MAERLDAAFSSPHVVALRPLAPGCSPCGSQKQLKLFDGGAHVCKLQIFLKCSVELNAELLIETLLTQKYLRKACRDGTKGLSVAVGGPERNS